MKKYQVFLIITLIFTLASCGSDQQSQSEPDTENNIGENENNENTKESSGSDDLNDEQEEELDTEIEEPFEAEYRIDEESSVVPINEANEKVALLTIDDAPDEYALEMAKTLQNLDANAIFFVNGHLLETEEKKKMLKEIYDLGFVIGNHTYSHNNLNDITQEEQKEEIIRVNDMVEEIIGERPKFFRAPFGEYTDYAKEVIANEHMVRMNWTYGYDYFEPYMNKESLVEAMVTGKGPEVDVDYSLLKPGANLLMHDREWTAAGLHDIVTGLREKGYEIVNPELIETKELSE